jgi:signal transduction histidine kinase
LTLLYIVIIVAIVVLLSSALYSFHAYNVRRLEHQRLEISDVHERQIAWAKGLGEYIEDLGRSIIIGDIITIIVAGGLSYILAGRTLRPIKNSIQTEHQFFANAAHDLRTPLAVMRTEAEVALRGGEIGSGDAERLIASFLEEISRMSTMVEQMMSLARRRAAGHDRHSRAEELVAVDLGALTRSIAGKMRTRARNKNVALNTQVEDGITIVGNPHSIERAMFNVIENAINYTPEAGSVTVRLRRASSHIELAVSDTGIGISADDLPHITEPFYRGDRARSTHTGGAGLGLTIARSTMTEHRGTLQAESVPAGGTTITLRFPAP